MNWYHKSIEFKKDDFSEANYMSLDMDTRRSNEELREMLREAEERKVLWERHFRSESMNIKKNAEALRNYTALRGVIKTLRWTLNLTDSNGIKITHPLD